MVTGDTKKTAQYIAALVGIETVIANASLNKNWPSFISFKMKEKRRHDR